ncbi:hypothetical protein CsSME_00026590 [Camellia sinensis var. sinensis]
MALWVSSSFEKLVIVMIVLVLVHHHHLANGNANENIENRLGGRHIKPSTIQRNHMSFHRERVQLPEQWPP